MRRQDQSKGNRLMSIRNQGFVTYSELQSYERRARELRSEAIRAGVATLFNIGKRDRAKRGTK